ncbi:integrase [Methanoculleus sp.]|uniref:integrase n=1 Tax=Methanoculleus sp. TaxID=90427 RepID=UPI001BD5839A
MEPALPGAGFPPSLRSFSPKDVTYDGDVAHIPAAAQSRVTKQSYLLFFPASFIPTLIAYAKSPASKQAYGTIQKRLAHGRVSAETIWKWHLYFMVEHGVSESIADFIQGEHPQP